MDRIHVLSGVACATVLLATGSFAAIISGQLGTSKNPADHAPADIQRNNDSQVLEHKADKGSGTLLVVEDRKEKNVNQGKDAIKRKHRKAAAVSEAGNDGPKQDPKMFREERSDRSVPGQELINAQPMDKQQPANRPASERGAGSN